MVECTAFMWVSINTSAKALHRKHDAGSGYSICGERVRGCSENSPPADLQRRYKAGTSFENTADVDTKDRYDVSVLIEITAESLVDGNEVSVFGGGFFETNYCSNNFEECRLWNGIDPASANRYSDQNIKQEYGAAQLLEYYRQGLELQSRLVELYCERQGEDGRENKSKGMFCKSYMCSHGTAYFL